MKIFIYLFLKIENRKQFFDCQLCCVYGCFFFFFVIIPTAILTIFLAFKNKLRTSLNF